MSPKTSEYPLSLNPLDDRGLILGLDDGLHIGLQAESSAEIGLFHRLNRLGGRGLLLERGRSAAGRLPCAWPLGVTTLRFRTFNLEAKEAQPPPPPSGPTMS